MSFFRQQVAERKEEIGGHVEGAHSSKASDVFTMLVEANESENQKTKLTIQDLVRCRVALEHVFTCYDPTVDWKHVHYAFCGSW